MITVTSIDLPVTDFMENVTLMLGWIINNNIWEALDTSSIAALPFVAIIIREWFGARREGEDEGNKGLLALNRIEAAFYAMILVYIFAAAPIMQVSFAPVNINQQHLNQCGTRVASGGTTFSGGAAIGGQTANIPLWWAIVHVVSQGLNNVAVNALPCQTDFVYMRNQLNLTSIKDPELQQEVANFQDWCYGQARAKLLRVSPNVGATVAENTDWIGSSYFLNTPGYYDTFQANQPVPGFAWNQQRDQGHGTPPSAGGYPSCKAWWSSPNNGLRARLHAQISPSWWNTFHSWLPGSQSADNYAIRALVTTSQGGAQGNGGSAPVASSTTGGPGGIVGEVGGFFGTMLETFKAAGERNVLSRALPMVRDILLMLLVIAIPFLLVISGYSFKIVGVLSFTYFGISTLNFWFALIHWLNNHLIGMLYSGQAAQLGFIGHMTSAYDQGVLRLVITGMLVVIPAIWMSMLGWAGFSVGNGLGGVARAGANRAGSAGSSGADVGRFL